MYMYYIHYLYTYLRVCIRISMCAVKWILYMVLLLLLWVISTNLCKHFAPVISSHTNLVM